MNKTPIFNENAEYIDKIMKNELDAERAAAEKNDNDIEQLIRNELEMEPDEDEAFIQSLPSNVLAPVKPTVNVEKGDMTPVITDVVRDPLTGVSMPTFIDSNDENIIDAEALLNKYMSSDSVSEDHLSKTIERLHGSFNNFSDFSLEDLSSITKLVNDHLNGKIENDYDYYTRLPEFYEKILFKHFGAGTIALPKTALAETSKNFIEELAAEYVVGDTTADLDTAIAQLKGADKELQVKLGNMQAGMHVSIVSKAMETLKEKRDELLKEGKTEEADKLLVLYDNMEESLHLSKFKEFCKRVKIKKYELERPDKVFLNFNRKYFNHRLNINDIRATPNVLNRHIKNNEEGVYKFCIAFCKYCLNFSPDNPAEHVIMYYFVKNILVLDLLCPNGVRPTVGETDSAVSPEGLKMYDAFLSAINECIAIMK